VRRLPLLPFALLLVAPGVAQAQAPASAGASVAAKVEPPASPEERPRSVPLAVTLEVLSPLGGPGCFYRRREVAGVLVVAGSLIAGGLLLYAVHHADPDATIINAVAYGTMRSLGVAAAAATWPDPPQRASALPVTTRALGLGYGFSF